MNLDDKELIDSFLNLKLKKPDEENKKKHGEVFTPPKLINEMLDKLPEYVWKNKDLKWFDPAVGVGNFMIEVYYRLMKGLEESIPELDERKNHIINNMLYMAEINENNVKICKELGFTNIYEGDSLKMPKDFFFDL